MGGVKHSLLEARGAGAGNMVGNVRDAYDAYMRMRSNLQCLNERLCSRASLLHGETIVRSITKHREELQLQKLQSNLQSFLLISLQNLISDANLYHLRLYENYVARKIRICIKTSRRVAM